MNIYGVMIQSSEPDGFMLRLICVFLGCDLPIRQLLKSVSSKYDDRLEDHFYLLSCVNSHHSEMLEQTDLDIFLPVIYKYSCFFV